MNSERSLFLTPERAKLAAVAAIAGKARNVDFEIRADRVCNADRSWDRGFVVRLFDASNNRHLAYL